MKSEIMLIQEQCKIGEGFYSKVFNVHSGKAYKLFKSANSPGANDNHNPEVLENEIRREVFESEKKAYEIINDSWLSVYFPKYFGTLSIEDVINDYNECISDHFLLECCLDLEYVTGEFDKYSSFVDKYPHQESKLCSIKEELLQLGIKSIKDISIAPFYNCFKIIDIATEEASEIRFQLINKRNISDDII